MKKYLELEQNPDATHLKVEVYYTKGGMNMFTYKEEPRGYYLSVSPGARERRDGVTLESYTAFSGIKDCVKQVSRKSDKAMREAEELAAAREEALIRLVCEKNGLTLRANTN